MPKKPSETSPQKKPTIKRENTVKERMERFVKIVELDEQK